MNREPRRGPFAPNPVFGSLIGLSPVIAVSDSLDRGLALGLGVSFAAFLVGALSRALGEGIPERLRAALAFAAAGAFAGLYGAGLAAWSPTLAAGLGIYLPLIAVNGLVIHAVERSRMSDSSGWSGALLSALGYCGAVLLVAGLRELLGSGSLSIPLPGLAPKLLVVFPFPLMRVFQSPAGGFILLGLLAAAWRAGLKASGRMFR